MASYSKTVTDGKQNVQGIRLRNMKARTVKLRRVYALLQREQVFCNVPHYRGCRTTALTLTLI